MRTHRSKRAILGATALSLLFAGSAFTASNTVDASEAGAGDSAVTGFTVENVSYSLVDDSDTIDEVTADVLEDATGATARVQFQNAAGTGLWYDCTVGVNADVAYASELTCAVSPAEDVETLDNLRVVVIQ